MYKVDVFETLEKIEERAVIKYFRIKGYSSIQIKAELHSTLDEFALSLTTIKNFEADFKCGFTSTDDAQRLGRPKTATSEEIIQELHNVVLTIAD